MAKKYRVLRERKLGDAVMATEGQVVYPCQHYDYGVSSDDTRFTGIVHVSVTHDPEGGYPFFTIPFADLKELKEE